MPSIRLLASFAPLAFAPLAVAQGGSFGAKHPFSPPEATVHYAPDRTYDLQDVTLDLNVDYSRRRLDAVATNRLFALRDGATRLRFHAGEFTKIDRVELDGRAAEFVRDAEGILVTCAPTTRRAAHVVVVAYHVSNADAKGPIPGFHFHEPEKNDPSKAGFWTNGETSDTRNWAVTWDYPNDFATSTTRTTVPHGWEVVGNGVRVSDKVSGDRRTVVWTMKRPHATYLLSVVAGPLSVRHDSWRGVPLLYVAPRGMEAKRDTTVEHTKDMLSFFSGTLGVKYPWPKYAEDFTYDFGGGQENVSATTFGLFLNSPRDGDHPYDELLSHEMGHQWFGDDVTCKNWGEIWLNESFATLMQMSYTLHRRGTYASQRDRETASQGYFRESRRYKRPMETNLYSDPGVMFDQHTYPKGGVLLMSLRAELGDKPFFAGLHEYLTRHAHSPVETEDLQAAMTDATGINLHPWFDQWIHKPGHPVIEWSWSYDDAAREAVVRVRQTQDASAGTPVYEIPAKVGLIVGDRVVRRPIHLSKADESFRIASVAKPDAVLFDPDFEFLREIPTEPWSDAELPSVAALAPNAVDRQFAFGKMLAGSPPPALVARAVAILRADLGGEPAFLDVSALAALKRPELRPFWLSELDHPNAGRRAAAAQALGDLPADPATTERLRSLVDDTQPYAAVSGALASLAKLDYAGSAALIERIAKAEGPAAVRGPALATLVEHDAPGALDLAFALFDDARSDDAHAAALTSLALYKGDDPRVLPTLRSILRSSDTSLSFYATQVARTRHETALIPDLIALKARVPQASSFIDAAIKEIEAKPKG